MFAGPGTRNPDLFSGKRAGGVDVYRAAGDGFGHSTRDDSRARNQFLRGKQFTRKRSQVKFQSGSRCGDRANIVSARGFRPAGTRWPISTDLQNCHHSSILSAHCNRRKSPTQVSRYESRAWFKEERPVEIDVRTQDQVKIVKLRGKLNLGASLDRTNETLKDLVNAGESRFLLDLQEVPMIDSSGIGLLVRYLTAAKQHGGSLKLLNPSKFALQTLKLVRVLSLFEVFEDQQVAVQSFQ